MLLGYVGVSIMPVLATDALVSLPWVSMSVVQSVIPISSALIVVAELTYLIELWRGDEPAPPADPAIATDALH